ncbi:pilus assembly protein TadG-related protein [Alcaligenaceae bacterium C4P045]|nr:pilus assembly protein TadG-related protein [Alcaligenaceae bacterium C4P045]
MMPGQPTRRDQRGSILIPAVFAVLVGLVLMGSAQIGYLYYMKRAAQNAADMAALSGAKVLYGGSAAECTAAIAAARTTVVANMPSYVGAMTGNELQVSCQRWDGTSTDAAGRHLRAPAAGEAFNAISVKIVKPINPIVPAITGAASTLITGGEAIAANTEPAAVFSVASQLARTSTTKNNLLGLLGVNLSALDASGIANAKLTPLALMQAAGIPLATDLTLGGTNALLNVPKLSLGQLINATATVVGGSQAASIRALIGQLPTSIDVNQVNINLFGDANTAGLLTTVTTAGKDAALTTSISALDLVSTAISVASAGRAAFVPNLSLLDSAISVQAGIVEPPSLAVGGVGTVAYNAQARIYVDIDTDKITAAKWPLLKTVFQTLNLRVHLPLVVDVATGKGTLTALSCQPPVRTATIALQSSLVKACIGIPNGGTNFSLKQACDDNLQKVSVLRFLGISLPPSRVLLNAMDTSVGGGTVQNLQFSAPTPTSLPMTATGATNALALDVIPTALSQALDLVGLVDGAATNSADIGGSKQLASQYLDATRNANGTYNLTAAVNMLRSGSSNQTAEGAIPALGDWRVDYNNCVLLILGCKTENISVWDAFTRTVSANNGLLSPITNLVGLTGCRGILTGLLSSDCVRDNLARFIDSAPSSVRPAVHSCGIVCRLSKTVLSPLLNSVSSLLLTTTRDIVGVELGRTDVTLFDIQCGQPRLVY